MSLFRRRKKDECRYCGKQTEKGKDICNHCWESINLVIYHGKLTEDR